MTAQISDTLNYQGRDYTIVEANGTELFNPHQYGLQPEMISTACYRGFFCQYQVVDSLLYLHSVHISLYSNRGPDLFGVKPKRDQHGNYLGYENIGRTMSFTGEMILGADFIEEMYVHSGFHPVYKYRRVHQLLFEQGQLMTANDLSDEMQQFQQMLMDRHLDPTEISHWQEIDELYIAFSSTKRHLE